MSKKVRGAKTLTNKRSFAEIVLVCRSEKMQQWDECKTHHRLVQNVAPRSRNWNDDDYRMFIE